MVGDLASARGEYRSAPRHDFERVDARAQLRFEDRAGAGQPLVRDLGADLKNAGKSAAKAGAGLKASRTEVGTTYDYVVFPADSGTYTLRGAVA
ncbi:hypothetical protein QRX50_26855 [Amycolatopsis carbonis]|uniref:Uncharacterized protein n=1 Tax=Amycolatopsis carbonis TaxID=715471 RepID=A0A9Y2MR84_9PSEU|nr:hypothetical protein [Amycolatopsis sp. 2-15]WIX75161.1 hypothetical protein QRX50_26855 [Amycolatopsis sp. 2-15]